MSDDVLLCAISAHIIYRLDFAGQASVTCNMKSKNKPSRDYKQLVHALFVLATELGEAAHDAAALGQDGRESVKQLVRYNRRMKHAAVRLVGVAEAIETAIVTRLI